MTYPQCGTTKGYHRHQREKTIACGPCLRALSTYTQALAIRNGRTQTLKVPLSLLAGLLGGPHRDLVRSYLGDAVTHAIVERFAPRSGAA